MPSTPALRAGFFPSLVLTIFTAALAVTALPSGQAGAASRSVIIEDFEGGSVVLESYPGEDEDPSSWGITNTGAYGGMHALRLYGNTWKMERIAPIALADTTVWQVAAYIEKLGEIQAFGLGDSTNELFYTFAGEQLPSAPKWWTANQGAFPEEEWYAYLLPVGRDFLATHGYLPVVDRVFYVNDDDDGSAGSVRFDEIADVSEDLPVPPRASITYVVRSARAAGKGLFLVGVEFHANVFDPDSDTHTFRWDFGDGDASTEQDPTHEFLVEALYTYTVGLLVRDEGGLAGNDTCQVRVDPGAGELPITVNFVGDVFTGRGYEMPGGIIDTYGIEALFEPTLPIFGNAADVNVCNLECSYTDRGTPHPTKSVVFRSRPENIAGIVYAGVDVVTTGNNHIIDYGEEGMEQTHHLLDSVGVAHSGAGTNEYFAVLPTFYTKNGVRMAFLGESNRTGREWNYQPFLDAAYNKPGFGYLLPHNLESSISEARDFADLVIVQLHSGDEYETTPGKDGPFEAPPPVEAMEIGPNDPDFRFRVEPSPDDRALRRLAADLGADIVINHHPHVLQGFESYDGKLIAHSLGNFLFDLSYAETFPTMVLTLEIDKDGILGYTVTPAWIDNWITQPATGTLGREILDRLADYSRPMGALLAVSPEENRARIFLARSETDSVIAPAERTDSLVLAGVYRATPPLPLPGSGNLSLIREVFGAGSGWEVRWGRDLLWHGVFEEEGATFWDLNSSDEYLDKIVFHGGAGSLALRRTDESTGSVGTDLERHLPCDPEKEHSIAGYARAENAKNARMSARFYSSRSSETPITSTDADDPLTGTCEWVRQWKDLETPSNGGYFEVRFANEPPSSGTGHAWFDDVAFVEWEPWVPCAAPLAVPSPNNFRFLQVRSAGAGPGTATVSFEETAYERTATSIDDRPPAAREALLRSYPNPFNPRTTIELFLPGEELVPVRLAVYDIRGRRVVALYSGAAEGGTTLGASWDGKDESGRDAPSGIYFARAEIGGRAITKKLVLLR